MIKYHMSRFLQKAGKAIKVISIYNLYSPASDTP